MSVSVITSSLNAADTIERTLASVLAQGEWLHEYIVVDGGSTDATVELLQSYEERFGGRLRWVTEPDDGIYDAVNKGLATLTGLWVLVLGADDVLEPGALRAISGSTGANQNADLIYGDAYMLEPDGRTRLQSSTGRPRFASGMPLEMPVCHQACAFSVRAYDRLGAFDATYRIAADYEFYLRFWEAALQGVRVPVPLATYSLTGVSTRRGLETAREYRDVRIVHGMSAVEAQIRMVRSLANLAAARVLRATHILR